ncbi:MAG: glycogen synthase GlgA [Verrucomicrobia bacterium]|nr:MAG: glycogen synthase GlgA [Verrucomicrobiota bacterium]
MIPRAALLGGVPLKILFVTPEVEPFVKVGGLADMAGSLPKALAALGHDVRIVIPAYGSLRLGSAWQARAEPLGVDVGSGGEWARTWKTVLPGSQVPVYALEHAGLFGRPEVYAGPWGDHADNDLRFAFLCRGALNLCLQLGWIPDVAHSHDWTTGLLPVLLNTTLRHTPLGRTASVFTIHNLEYQGHANRRVLDYAHIPPSEFRSDSTESGGSVNMMKAGLYHATKLTTVSPTYAEEIQTPSGGWGLDPVLRFRSADLLGILNGIDDAAWNPAMDKYLPLPYSPRSVAAGKAAAKLALQLRLGLDPDPQVALFGVVSRFAAQKGLDLIAEALPHVLDRMHVQFAILGAGDPGLEQTFRWASGTFPGRVGLHVGYDNGLAHLIQAGADVFVMPSRAEPCGLTQMYAMRYGTLPLVRATGGLIDTVEQYVEGTATGTGFRFNDANAPALYNTIGWACATYYDRAEEFRAMRVRGMMQNFSWGVRAQRYEEVYRWAAAARVAAF